jgi:hypothetical protein
MLSWDAASMEETALRRNKLPLLFLHLSAGPFRRRWGAGGPVISSISRSGEIRVWWSALLWVTVMSANIVVFAVDEGMTPRSSIFAYLVPAKEEARSKDTQSPQGPTFRLGVEGKNYL